MPVVIEGVVGLKKALSEEEEHEKIELDKLNPAAKKLVEYTNDSFDTMIDSIAKQVAEVISNGKAI